MAEIIVCILLQVITYLVQLWARAILLVFQIYRRAHFFQISLEIIWLPIRICLLLYAITVHMIKRASQKPKK